MAFPRSFLRHTLLWNLPGGEKAACGVAWDNDGGGIVSVDSATLTAFVSKSNALWTAIKGQFSTDMSFSASRLAWIGIDGKTVETYDLAITPDTGSSGQPSIPSECAVVCSLRSATNNRSGRGRIYLPAVHKNCIGTGGRLVNAEQVAIANGVDTYLNQVTIGASDYFPVVASVVQMQLRPVTQLRVGDVFDAQRRRRDTLVEVYETRAVN